MYISLETLEFFAYILMIIACAYYSYKSGSRNGWDEAIFSLEDAGYLYVDDNGKVNRISDKEFKQIQSEMNE